MAQKMLICGFLHHEPDFRVVLTECGARQSLEVFYRCEDSIGAGYAHVCEPLCSSSTEPNDSVNIVISVSEDVNGLRFLRSCYSHPGN